MTAAAEVLGRALVELADRGHATPCQGRRRDRWTSDDATERAWAAAVCVGLSCQLLEECGLAADEQGERFGVWVGTDRTVAAPKTKRES